MLPFAGQVNGSSKGGPHVEPGRKAWELRYDRAVVLPGRPDGTGAGS